MPETFAPIPALLCLGFVWLDGRTLCIVTTRFDAAMAAARDADLQELAPQSVHGF